MAVRLTADYPLAHGAPLHVGDPAAIGIADLGRPDFGDPIEPLADEVPVFWACGVTPQAVAMEARPPLITKSIPGNELGALHGPGSAGGIGRALVYGHRRRTCH